MRRFLSDTGGNVAMIFALALLPISVLVGGSIDLSRMHVERAKLQSAIDAASLAAANMPITSTDEQIRAAVNNFINNNFNGVGTLTNISIQRDGTSVDVSADSLVPMTFAALMGQERRPVSARAGAARGGVNIEMAMVLDITGSMTDPADPNNRRGPTRLDALQEAAADLIDIVIQDVQEPYYTKAAIIPYSNAVNPGSAATALRGAITAGRGVTSVEAGTGTAREITGATRANPVVITSNGHGFQNGQRVYITGVRGMTQINDRAYIVRNRTNNTYELYDLNDTRVDGRNYGTFTTFLGRGAALRCVLNDCSVRVTVNSHGFVNGQRVHITDLPGEPGRQLNNTTYTVAQRENNRFVLAEAAPTFVYSSGSGSAWCTTQGCEFYEFTNAQNRLNTLRVSNCVTERTGSNVYNDVAPSGSSNRLGRAYQPSNNGCPDATVTTLTSNRARLHSEINRLTASGSTAGHIGVAWGWYALSPRFNGVLGNDAAPYDAPETLKIAVIMTDGEFNTAHCNGVIARDSGAGSGSAANHIGCNATNGDSFSQAEALCRNMRNAGVTIYTVTLGMSEGSEVGGVMRRCASEPSYAYLAQNGQQLNSAFRAIGDSIGRLRLTQ